MSGDVEAAIALIRTLAEDNGATIEKVEIKEEIGGGWILSVDGEKFLDDDTVDDARIEQSYTGMRKDWHVNLIHGTGSIETLHLVWEGDERSYRDPGADISGLQYVQIWCGFSPPPEDVVARFRLAYGRGVGRNLVGEIVMLAHRLDKVSPDWLEGLAEPAHEPMARINAILARAL